MTEEGRTALLAHLGNVSEFRFVYWRGDGDARRYTVERDWDHRSDLWGIFEGTGGWDGERWVPMPKGPWAFRWSLDEALRIAEKLAYEENQHIIETMERRFPGEFKGGEFDLARTWTGADVSAEHHIVDGTQYLCHRDDHYCPQGKGTLNER